MPRHLGRRVSAVVAALAAFSISLAAPSPTAHAGQPPGYGPSDPFEESLQADDGKGERMRSQAVIERTRYGYVFTAAQQNTRLRVSLADGRLRFRDRGTPSWKRLPDACTKRRVTPGVVASCRVPRSTSQRNPTLLEIHPRLGNDYVNGHGLPATFEMAVLGDDGRDTVVGGRGNDYVTGAMRADRVRGGAGKDWIRGGSERDRLWGGPDSDWIVGMEGRDRIDGGDGRDRIFQ